MTYNHATVSSVQRFKINYASFILDNDDPSAVLDELGV